MMRRSSVVGLRFQSQQAASSANQRSAVAAVTLAGLVLITGATYSIPTSSAEIVGVGGTPIKEPATGILFPKLVNGFYFAGCGVRVKYMFVQVYAVASYFDPLAMSAVKTNPAALEDALVNPTYPRVIKIIMNRSLSADKMTSALVEALEPRMKGKDLDKLEEFKKMNPPIDLVKGTTPSLNTTDTGSIMSHQYGRCRD